MTTQRIGTESGDEERRVVIRSPEELIASIPAMLGFPPGPGSMVVMCGRLDDGRQGPVVRLDIPGLLGTDGFGQDEPGPGRAKQDEDVARSLARYCAREGVDGVHLVVVHPGCADDPEGVADARDAADVFDFWLGTGGVRVSAAYGVGTFGAGEPWVDLVGMAGGAQVDPDSTEIAAVYAFDGRMRASSREEIEQLYRQRDEDARDDDPHGPGPTRSRGRSAVARAVRTHEVAAARSAGDGTVSDPELATVGSALRDIAVRDELYAGLARRPLEDGDGRRRLWWAVARRRPDRERSVALTLLGAAAYFAGSGVHARAALDAALTADEDNTLAGLLLEGLDRGIAPDDIRRLVLSAA